MRVCHQAASRFGVVVLESQLHYDEERTGATSDRPGYQALLAAAKARQFDAILVESQDRLWRDQAEMHAAIKRLRFLGTKVLSVATGSDLTDYSGRVVATVLGLKDEIFLEDLRAKTHRGMAGTIARGLGAGGRAFGYRSEPLLNEAGVVVGARRVVDPAEADIVRLIYRWYADGMTPRAIVHRLNADQVAPPRGTSHRTVRGWTPATLFGASSRALGILNNPLYAGQLLWNRSQKVRDPDTGKRIMQPRPRSEWLTTHVPELRIVSKELWADVQARREARRKTASGSTGGMRPKYLLSGLLVCGECAAHYIITSKHPGQHLYACAAHKQRGPMICANGRTVRRERIEKTAFDYVFGDLFSPERLAYLSAAVDEALARAAAGPDSLLRDREAALAGARRELDNIAAAIRQGSRNPATLVAMLGDAEQRVALLEAAVAAARRPALVEPFKASVERFLHDLRGTLQTNTDKARRLLARALDRIVLQCEGSSLVAHFYGNIAGVLQITDQETLTARAGAGRGI